MIRDDVAGKTDNLCFEWETGDAAATAAVFDGPRSSSRRRSSSPASTRRRSRPAARWPTTTGSTSSSRSGRRPRRRTPTARCWPLHRHRGAPDPGHRTRRRRRLRQQGADLPRLRLRDRRLDGHRQAGQVGRGPHREPRPPAASPATTSCRARSRPPGTGRILAVRSHVLADHGAFNGAATPTKFPGGFFGVFTGSYDLEAAYCSMTAVHTNKAPGGVAYACSFRIAEAVYLVERMVDILADELGIDPVELRLRNFIQPDQFPYVSRTGWVYDSGNYAGAWPRPSASRGTTSSGPSRPSSARARRADGHRGRVLHRGGRRRAAQGHGHGRARHGRRLRAAHPPHRHGRRPDLRADPGPGSRDDLRPDRRRGDRHPPRTTSR